MTQKDSLIFAKMFDGRMTLSLMIINCLTLAIIIIIIVVVVVGIIIVRSIIN